jgi:2-polyprenyl-3-methyl-5-hydroxy-6-metoxy-1,4-benzoquinol methylase
MKNLRNHKFKVEMDKPTSYFSKRTNNRIKMLPADLFSIISAGIYTVNRNIHYRMKGNENYYQIKQGNNQGQFGYYFNSGIAGLIVFMLANEFSSVVDLGCGPGDTLQILEKYGMRVKGFEIEPDFIRMSEQVYPSMTCIEQKDICKLDKVDIRDYQVIYFWEPISDYLQCKKFVSNLVEIMNSNQIIFMKPNGYILDILSAHSRVEEITNGRGSYFGHKIFKKRSL